MNRILFPIAFFLLIIGCSKEKNSKPAELDNPSRMVVFCKKSLKDTLYFVEYKYHNDNLISKTSLVNGKATSETFFDYNSINQVISEVYMTNWFKSEKTFVYNTNNLLVNILNKTTRYDINGQIADETYREAPREYENNKLVKEWALWGGFSTYEYHGDKIVIKVDHTKGGSRHHVTTYQYSGELLMEEKKETVAGNLMYIKNFKYDSQNRLIQIKEGNNIIEENDYFHNRLIEKRTYYFGMDPGFDICHGNYVYGYGYN